MEEIKLRNEQGKILDSAVKDDLKSEQHKNINMYYRCEGTFVFSFISLLFCIFWWDTISDPLFYFIFTVVLNLLLMVFFLFRHFKEKGLI